MLTKPVFKNGYWIYLKEGLHIYDGSNRLFKIIEHEKALKHGSVLFENDFNADTVKYGDKGINDTFETEEYKKEQKEAWDYYKSNCTECEKSLPKRHYSLDGKYLCTKCYKKKDTFMNNIKVS